MASALALSDGINSEFAETILLLYICVQVYYFLWGFPDMDKESESDEDDLIKLRLCFLVIGLKLRTLEICSSRNLSIVFCEN